MTDLPERRRADETAAGGGFLVAERGLIRIGARGWRATVAVLHAAGIEVQGPAATTEISWDDLDNVSFAERPRGGLRSAPYDLVLEHGGSTAFRLGHSRGPLPCRADYAAVEGLLRFCRRYTRARDGLADPRRTARLVAAAGDAVRRTRRPPSLERAWPEAPEAVRRDLAEAIHSVLVQAGVEYFAGRAVRGYRIEPDTAAIAAARIWLPDSVLAASPPDAVIAAALDSLQGAVPPWPFDALLDPDVSA